MSPVVLSFVAATTSVSLSSAAVPEDFTFHTFILQQLHCTHSAAFCAAMLPKGYQLQALLQGLQQQCIGRLCNTASVSACLLLRCQDSVLCEALCAFLDVSLMLGAAVAGGAILALVPGSSP